MNLLLRVIRGVGENSREETPNDIVMAKKFETFLICLNKPLVNHQGQDGVHQLALAVCEHRGSCAPIKKLLIIVLKEVR